MNVKDKLFFAMDSVQVVLPLAQPHPSPIRCRIDHCNAPLGVQGKRATRTHINHHVNSLAWGESPRIQCPWEGCTTELRKKSMCKHVVNVHCGADRQTCQFCGLRVSTSDALLRHQEASCRGDGTMQN